MTHHPAPDTAPTPELAAHHAQRAATDAQHVAMIKAAAQRRTVTGRLADGRPKTGVLVRWPHPHRSHRRTGRRALIVTPTGAYLSIVADLATTHLHDQEPAAS